MRALIQRVSQAEVAIQDATSGTFDGLIEGEPRRSIGRGFVIFLGVGKGDGEAEADRLWRKISKMRIFADGEGRTNLALGDVAGELLIVSQFTLFANCRKGNRPSFADAGDPAHAGDLYRYFCAVALRDMGAVSVGEFGADMAVSLVNDGPFTIWLDTDEL